METSATYQLWKPVYIAIDFQNPATDRDLCYEAFIHLYGEILAAFRILRRIETSATLYCALSWKRME